MKSKGGVGRCREFQVVGGKEGIGRGECQPLVAVDEGVVLLIASVYG
jgi:hypothetical protein